MPTKPLASIERGPRTQAGRELVKAVKEAVAMNPEMKQFGQALNALVENGVIRAENEARRAALNEPVESKRPN